MSQYKMYKSDGDMKL